METCFPGYFPFEQSRPFSGLEIATLQISRFPRRRLHQSQQNLLSRETPRSIFPLPSSMRFEGTRCSALAASNSTSNSKNCVLLSDACMSYVISHTSPRDACRASLVSRCLKCFANSDAVWNRFLPFDYEDILSRSATPVTYSSKKELYFRLCDSPVLLDDGNLDTNQSITPKPVAKTSPPAPHYRLPFTMKFEGGGSPGAAESNSNHVNSIFLSQPCMSYIISHTSPRDACRASLVSRSVKRFANSDVVWGRFLPSDYQHILSRSVSPVNYSSKKQLYFRLCDSPLLLDDGNLSFYLYKQNGKKCFMLGAKALSIAWSNTVFWRWRSSPESRFSEVAELLAVCWLEIVGKFKTSMLSSNTRYVAYLVYNIGPLSHGLDFPATTSVRHIDDTTDDDDDDFATTVVYLKPPPNASDRTTGGVPQKRADGWMEIELGKFYNDRTESEVDIRFTETRELHWKAGLIIEGIDIRPTSSE